MYSACETLTIIGGHGANRFQRGFLRTRRSTPCFGPVTLAKAVAAVGRVACTRLRSVLGRKRARVCEVKQSGRFRRSGSRRGLHRVTGNRLPMFQCRARCRWRLLLNDTHTFVFLYYEGVEDVAISCAQIPKTCYRVP